MKTTVGQRKPGDSMTSGESSFSAAESAGKKNEKNAANILIHQLVAVRFRCFGAARPQREFSGGLQNVGSGI